MCAKASTQMWGMILSCITLLASVQAHHWNNTPHRAVEQACRKTLPLCRNSHPFGIDSTQAAEILHGFCIQSLYKSKFGKLDCPCCIASQGSVPSLCWVSFHHYPYFPIQYLHTWKHMDSTEAISSLFIQQTMSISLLTHLQKKTTTSE